MKYPSKRIPKFKDYYIGAGCIAKRMELSIGNPLLYGINDIDFAYFDEDLSRKAEDNINAMIHSKFPTARSL